MKASGCAILLLLTGGAVSAAQVEVFSPQGEVKGVRQAAVRFSEPMVAFGDPRLPEPFDIDCPEPGSARWADQKNWVYDFGRDLPAGVRCSFRLKPGLLSIAGDRLEGGQTFEFSTGGPAIVETLPYEGVSVDEEQTFILGLDAAATDESIIANAYCDIKGITERVELRVLAGDDRRVVLEAGKDFVHRFVRSLMRGTRMEKLLKDGATAALPVAAVQCKRRLPNNAEMRLVWGKGIVSASGVATSRDQAIAYRVRDAFQARFTCDRVNKDAQCLPIMPMRLSFTAPVARTMAEKIVLKNAAGKAHPAELPDARGAAEFVEAVSFSGPFPERAQYVVEIPADVTDDAGRKLANQKRFPLQVRTDEYPPLAKFPARFGIIELKGDGMMPVTLRNLEALVEARMVKTGKQDDPVAEAADRADQAINWLKKKLDESKHDETGTVPGSYSRVADGDVMAMLEWSRRLRQMEHDRWGYDVKKQEQVLEYQVGQSSIFNERDRVRRVHVPKPQGARSFEVVGIPLKKAGFYVVELASPRLGAALLKARNRPYYVQSAALVTNLAVHFKWGREISLVWVTTLDTGVPVPKAQVAIQDCSGKVYYRGQTDTQGRARIAAVMPERERLPACLTAYDRQLVVSARLGEDLSFVMSEWNEGISRWRYNLRGANSAGPHIATTVFDRTLLRAGETVSMKHYYRRHGAKGFAFVPVDGLPKKVIIQHQGSDEKYEVPLNWDARNSAETAWKIPEGAKKGSYSVLMTDTLDTLPGARGNTRTSGRFRVEEFRVPLMKAEISGPKAPQVKAQSVNLDVSLRYLAGGGAGYAPVKVRAVLRPKSVTFRDYDGFAFANGRIVAGIEQQGAYQWFAQDYELDDADATAAAAPGSGVRPLKSVALDLDATGSARVTLPGLPASDSPQELNAEMEYADPNGEILTTSARVTLWPSKVILGIKPDSWALSQERLKFRVIALDLAGKPVSNQQVKVQLFVRDMFTHRKRLVGGFYGYESGAEVKQLDVDCAGKTDERGGLFCSVKPPVSGNILMAAETKDRDGNVAYANGSAWVAGKDAWWFDQSNDDRMDLIPERKRYEPGETAQLQVRMPFQQATALITVEREGVIESFVQTLSGAAPVVKVPMKGNYAPNVFVSVLVVRGRIADPQPTAVVDLGKPSFKMGVTELGVGWRAHELGVTVSAGKPAYKVRETARVAVHVTQRAGGKPAPVKSGEVTIAAVDEGLLELLPNDSWKLLDAMMRPRGVEVDTSTASMQVVGKRHYGRKALAHGGGGGLQNAREIFDSLLMWKARVPLDAKGRAVVDIPLNDSLTSFRIIAVADSGAGLFGTGEMSIRATQDLMLHSGLAPLVREGDRFDSRFTVRNASERVIDVEVNANLEGQALQARRITLGPGEARDVGWETTVPVNATVLRWELSASELSAPGKLTADRLKVTQKVNAATPVRTFQASLSQLEQPIDMVVKIPEDALPERGGISVALAPKLSGPMPGVRDYMETYSYTCLEQRVSRAVALRDQALWQQTMDALPSFLDRDGFAKYFAMERTGSDTLTAYILAIAHESGWSIPEGTRGRMHNALIAFATGRARLDSPLPTADLTIRKVAALEALSRYQSLEPNWLDPIAAEPNLWPTSAVLDWYLVMKRGAALKDRDKRLAEAEQIVRLRLNFQGTTMAFSTERTDYLWWLMISGDVNANRALLAFLDADQWREDMPRLARGALGRQHRGRWSTTVANAWGVLAMEKFSAKFEPEPITGQTQGRLNEQQGALDWGRQAQGGVLEFKWPPADAALSLSQSGTGKPWVTVQSRAAIPLKTAVSSGFRVVKTVVPVETRVPGELRRGDVVRVRLELESQSDMAWVVVDDPVPAGSAILGAGLAKDSQILSSGEQQRGFVWPAFEERTFDAFRAYYRFVPKGAWVVEYTLRLNNVGRFELPPTRIEAMYAPEMFGELPSGAVTVNP